MRLASIGLGLLVTAATTTGVRADDTAERVASGWSAVFGAGITSYRDDADGFTYEATGPQLEAVVGRHFGTDTYAQGRLGLTLTDNEDSGGLYSGDTTDITASVLFARRFGVAWIGLQGEVYTNRADFTDLGATGTTDGVAVGVKAAGFVGDDVRLGAGLFQDFAETTYSGVGWADQSADATSLQASAQLFVTDDLAVTGYGRAAFFDSQTSYGVGGTLEYRLPDTPLAVYGDAGWTWVDRETGGDFDAQTVTGGIRLFLDGDTLKQTYRDGLPLF
jgi:hypothetical protein